LGTERTTVPLAREICVRENIRGLIANSITRSGQQFELTTELIDPVTGATVRSYEERADSEDHILDALNLIASQVRADLGESLREIGQASRPLPQVTTSSLTALGEYAEGSSLWTNAKHTDAVILYKAAIELDPDFAMAHAALGRAYASHIYYQLDLGRKEYEKAISLTSRLTEREGRLIEARRALGMDAKRKPSNNTTESCPLRQMTPTPGLRWQPHIQLWETSPRRCRPMTMPFSLNRSGSLLGTSTANMARR